MHNKKEFILFIVFIILSLLMFGDAFVMLYMNEEYEAVKEIVLGMGFGIIGIVYLLSAKNKR